ncbi:hypothetical protein FRB93_001907 [Tulasnella sp. JGI-2019a]|nr:hypothetical protein FRB93_001907 [Tulasnella sp. JGI-2019a]
MGRASPTTVLASITSLQLNDAPDVAVGMTASATAGGQSNAALSGPSRQPQKSTVSARTMTTGEAEAATSTSAALGQVSDEASTHTAPPSSPLSAWITIALAARGLGMIATVVFGCWKNGYALKFMRKIQAWREDGHASRMLTLELEGSAAAQRVVTTTATTPTPTTGDDLE